MEYTHFELVEALDEVMNYLDKDITSEEFREKFLAMGSKFKGASVREKWTNSCGACV